MRTTALVLLGAGSLALGAFGPVALGAFGPVAGGAPAAPRPAHGQNLESQNLESQSLESQSRESQQPALTLEEVAAGVFAAIQPHERRFDDANTMIVPCAEHGSLLVDPPSERARLDALIEEIRRRGWRVGEVVSTHWHSDHTQGNAAIRAAFADGVDLLAHESLSEDVQARTAAAHTERVALYEREIPAARDRLARRVRRDGSPLEDDDVPPARAAIERAEAWLESNRDARFPPPTSTYSRRMVLHRCGRRIELLHFRAHTRGDTVVRLPELGIAATGDLLDDLPYVGHGHPRSWVRTLEEIGGWDLRAIVPGHGPLFAGEESARAKLDTVLGFLRELVAATDAALAGGLTREQALEQIDLTRWRVPLTAGDAAAERFFDGTLAEAIGRAYDEAVEIAGVATPPP